MPSLFLCHGAPTLVLEENGYTSFLRNLGASLTPEAIVVFTAHWETKPPRYPPGGIPIL